MPVANLTIEDILLCCLALGVLYFVYKINRSKTQKVDESSELDEYNFCANPNCLRCSSSSNEMHGQLKVYADNEKIFCVLPRLRKWNEQTKNAFATLHNELQKPTVFYLPHLKTLPVVESNVYEDDVAILESNCDVILKELVNLLFPKAERTSWKTNSTPIGQWNVFYLINQGQKISANVAQCPETTKLIKSLPNALNDCAFGNACFSVLDSGTSISEHYGPCNVRIRCHLGLRVSNVWHLNVNNTTLKWKERKCILFDDSFLHSVSFNGNNQSHKQHRIILMVDLWHYGLSANERLAITKLFPPQ